MYINQIFNQILPATQLDMDMLDETISKDCTSYKASSIHFLEVVVYAIEMLACFSLHYLIIILATCFPTEMLDPTLIFQHLCCDILIRLHSNIHSWHTYPQASLNYKIHRKLFQNQIPMNRKAQF